MVDASSTIIVIHKGTSDFLLYCLLQSASCGYRTVLLTDNDEYRYVPGVTIEMISDYEASALAFRKKYIHIGVNSEEYERFCYERWFVLHEFLSRHPEHGPVIAIDSDVLVYPGIEKLSAILGKYELTDIPWFNYFRNAESLAGYLRYVSGIFSSEGELQNLAGKYAFHGHPHLSDMFLFTEYARIANAAPLRDFGRFIGIDDCIRDIQHFQNINHHKVVSFADGIPFCKPDVGGETRYFAFHFQGGSKALMEFHHTIRSDLCSDLPVFRRWLDRPEMYNSENYTFIVDHYNYLSSKGTENEH